MKNPGLIMREETKKIIENMIQQIKEHVPEYGDFTPIMEVFPNPYTCTQDEVGKFGLRVYKMPKNVVDNPQKRYLEAAAYVPSGMYKSDWVIASGTNEEIIAEMQEEDFAEKLYKAFEQLADLFINFD